MTKEEFISKAYGKIAALGDEYIKKEGRKDLRDDGLDLIAFLKELRESDSLWNDNEVQQYIDYLSAYHKLNRVPYLAICGCENIIVKCCDTPPIDLAWLEQYIITTVQTKVPHNTLPGLEGGENGHWFHVTTPIVFVAPTVGLAAKYNNNPLPAVNEKGLLISPIQLIPTIVLNSGKSILRVRYYKNGVQLGAQITSNFLVPKSDSDGIKDTTIYRIEVDFEEGGTKSATTQINFGLPIWFGLELADATTTDIQQLTKKLELPSPSVEFIYIFTGDNVNNELNPEYAYVLFPSSYGNVNRILEYDNPLFNGFEDWIPTNTSIVLADASSEPYKLWKFKKKTQGTFNPFFKIIQG